MTFEQWMKEVDAYLNKHHGLDSRDLDDCCYADWHAQKVTPRLAARRAVRLSGGDVN